MLREWIKHFWWMIPIQVAWVAFVIWAIIQLIKIGRAAVGI